MTALRTRSRRQETDGLLSVLVLIIIGVGVLLSAFGRTPWSAPSDTLNVNRADADTLALALEIDPVLADRLVAWRDAHGGFGSLMEFAAVPCIDQGPAGDVARRAISSSDFDPNIVDPQALATRLGIARALAARITVARQNLPGQRFGRATDVASVAVLDARAVSRVSERLIVRSPARAIAGLLLVGAFVSCLLGGLFAAQRRLWPTADSWILPLAGLVTGLSYLCRSTLGDPLRDPETHVRAALAVCAGAVALLLTATLAGRGSRHSGRPESTRSGWSMALPALTLVWLLLCLAANAITGNRWTGLCWLGPILVAVAYGQWLADRGALIDDAMNRWGRARHDGRTDRFAAADALAPGACFVVFLLSTRRPGVAVVAAVALLLVQWLAGLHASRRVWSLVVTAIALAGWLWAAGARWSTVEMAQNAARLGWAMASSGWHGSGLGLSYPARDVSGMAEGSFARVAEELGLFGAVAVLLTLAALVTRLCRSALRAPDDAARLRLGACAAVLAAASATGLLASTTVIPPLGALLPFAADSHLGQAAWFGLLGLALGWGGAGGQAPLGAARTAFRRSLEGLATTAALVIVGVVGLRLAWIEAIVPDRFAGAVVHWQGARGEQRSLVNPRLLALASSIERGSIADRDGRILATSSLRDISARLPDDLPLARRYFRAGRYYPYGASCATILGLCPKGVPPTAGIEAAFDRELRGFGSWSELAAPYRLRNLPFAFAGPVRRGRDVKLSISGPLQEDAYRLLRSSGDGGAAAMGALVVLSAIDGTPIVSASSPSFDPNAAILRYSRTGIGGVAPLATIDRAAGARYRPGSLLKVAAAVALSPEQMEFIARCNHRLTGLEWTHEGRRYTADSISDDPRDAPHGRIGLLRATKLSCEVYFAEAAAQAGVSRLYDGLRRTIPGAVMPDAGRVAETLPEALAGRGDILVSPIGMASLMAGICSGAGPVSPSYWYEVAAGQGKPARAAPSAAPVRSMSAGFAAVGPQLVGALRDAVVEGPAESAFRGAPLTVGGKAASVPSVGSDDRNDAWFVGFAPARRPVYAVACVIEGGGSGLRRAAPVVARMLHELSSR